MMWREFLGIALANLWRMKLRTGLTAVGVMVGVGALVSMLSFGFGMQRNVMAEFRKIGLFRTIQVLPGKPAAPPKGRMRNAHRDSTVAPRQLDEAALDTLAAIPGVSLVYPQHSFDARVTIGDSTRGATVQALPAEFTRHRPFGTIRAGRFFAADSAREAVVSEAWVKRAALTADSLVGRTMTVATAGSAQMITAFGGRLLEQYGIPARFSGPVMTFLGKLLSWGRTNAVQVTVVGIADVEWGFGFRMGEILLPAGIVQSLDVLPVNDPMELLAMSSGAAGSRWPMIIVTTADDRGYEAVKRRIEKLGFSTISFPDQLERMRRDFLVFDAFVALLAFVALFVAALGIANTMIMSILERTREIGVLKSLGAEDADVRTLFLAEAAAIGILGSTGGVLLGLGVSRIASWIAQAWMAHQGVPRMDVFYIPVWALAAAIGFGTFVSIAAGLYPAARAARIDPVHALRHD